MLKIGHRGASGTMPENTLAAFKKAMELGADGIELDVHLCKSGELVVIHDDTVDRTTTGKGRVADMKYAELCMLGVPSLGEVIEALGKTAVIFIEIKHADAAVPAAKLIKSYIARGWRADYLMMISFDHAALVRAHEVAPNMVIGASFEKLEHDSIRKAAALGARAIIPHHQPVNAAYIAEARAAGLDVVCWTVNEKADIARLLALGVDGIMSDYPERLK